MKVKSADVYSRVGTPRIHLPWHVNSAEIFSTSGIQSPSMTRRTVLRIGTLATGYFMLSGLSFGEVQAKKATGLQNPHKVVRIKDKVPIVFVWLDGGAGGPETFATKSDIPGDKNYAPPEIRGNFKSIQTSIPGIHVSELMPRMAQRMQHVVQFNNIHHTNGNHDQATSICFTGSSQSKGNSMVPEYSNPYVEFSKEHLQGELPYTVLNTDSAINLNPALQRNDGLFAEWNYRTGSVTNAPAVGNIDLPRVQARLGIRDQLNTGKFESRQTQRWEKDIDTAVSLLGKGIHKAFDLNSESKETRERYGLHGHGSAGLAAKRLIEMGAEFIVVNSTYWDDHYNIHKWIPGRAEKLDSMLSALIDDLKDIAYIVVVGEFGRTPKIDPKTNGRHHWPFSNFMLVAGPGVNGGKVIDEIDNGGQIIHTDDRPKYLDERLDASLMADSILSLGGCTRVWTETGQRFPVWEGFEDALKA